MKLKNSFVLNQLYVFVNSLIVNPAFKSQTKEALNTNVPDFGSRCELNDKFVKKMMKLSIVE